MQVTIHYKRSITKSGADGPVRSRVLVSQQQRRPMLLSICLRGVQCSNSPRYQGRYESYLLYPFCWTYGKVGSTSQFCHIEWMEMSKGKIFPPWFFQFSSNFILTKNKRSQLNLYSTPVYSIFNENQLDWFPLIAWNRLFSLWLISVYEVQAA